MIFKKQFFLLISLIFVISCNSSVNNGYKNGMVVSAKIEASQAGISILKQGGNAFDAMIATDLALSVVYPNAGNLGGGGFLVYRLSNSSYGSLDFREKSPSQSTKNMFLDENENEVKGLSTEGGLSVGVPGTIAGLFKVYEKYATLPLNKLFEPAIKLDEQGYVLTKNQANSLNSNRNKINQLNDTILLFNKTVKNT